MEKKKGLFAEFKEFMAQGNALNMAVGVVIGGAFSQIVTAIVDSIINPIIGLLCGGVDFSEVALGPFPVGQLIMAVINFVMVAFVLFLIVRAVNKAKEKLNAEKIAAEKAAAEEAAAAQAAAEAEEKKRAEEVNELLRGILEAVKK
ncbi:MAG: large conductance mechanosensitive channel protein MscL [Oscillospiraceae bacterium]|nr:large conductance mechanosensitive channel protein MscL [Oscillospiraceae bacterium]MBQ5342201.1 large conductance mechanosensitive channel protein MscL [Oscillospiraceae bacterium]